MSFAPFFIAIVLATMPLTLPISKADLLGPGNNPFLNFNPTEFSNRSVSDLKNEVCLEGRVLCYSIQDGKVMESLLGDPSRSVGWSNKTQGLLVFKNELYALSETGELMVLRRDSNYSSSWISLAEGITKIQTDGYELFGITRNGKLMAYQGLGFEYGTHKVHGLTFREAKIFFNEVPNIPSGVSSVAIERGIAYAVLSDESKIAIVEARFEQGQPVEIIESSQSSGTR